MINDLKKHRTARLGDSGKAADDVVVNEFAKFLGRNAAVDIRIEHFEEIPKLFALRFFAKILEGLQCDAVPREIIRESDRVQAEVRAGEIGASAIAFDA